MGNKGKKNIPIVAISLFVIVLLATTGLYIFNYNLSKNIEEQNEDLSKVETSIADLKKDKNLQIYSLLETNKSILKEMNKRNKITDYMKHLSKISAENSISFSGFNLSNGKITTKASARNKTDKLLAYRNVKNFIKKYREDENALFDLEFINSFEGMDNMKFNVSFNIK